MRTIAIFIVFLASCSSPRYGNTLNDAYVKSAKTMKKVERKQNKRLKHGDDCPSFK